MSGGDGIAGDFGIGGPGGAGGNPGPPVVPAIVEGPATGTLEIVAGQLGGLGNLDGVGADARFRSISSMALDDADRRLFLIDGYCCSVSDSPALRVIDLDTARVTTISQQPYSSQVLYQRGYLYLPGPAGILKISARTGALTATLPAAPIYPLGDGFLPEGGCYVAAPDADAIFYPCGGSLTRIDSNSGSAIAIPYVGRTPSGYNGAVAMPSANTILLADSDYSYSLATPVERLLQIDVTSGVVSVLLDYSGSDGVATIDGLDPTGQFFIAGGFQVLPIDGGAVPPFVPFGAMARDSTSTLYVGYAPLLTRWSPPLIAPAPLAGRDSADDSQDPLPREGPGASVAFDHPIMNLSVIGDSAFATQADATGLAVIDLASGSVSLSQLTDGSDIAAILPAPAGTYYVAARSSCAVSHVYPDGRPAETLFAGRDTCRRRAGNPTNPANFNWATVGLASVGSRLFMVANDDPSIVSIDPSLPSSVVTLPLSRLLVVSPPPPTPQDEGPTGIAAGSDGQLYVTWNGYILRVDPAQGGGIRMAVGGARVAADEAGHLFTTFGDSVLRIDIATGATTRIIGTAQTTGVVLGPLPGSLNQPEAIAVTSSGELLLANSGERVLLRAHLQ
jgi:hypothetical protein